MPSLCLKTLMPYTLQASKYQHAEYRISIYGEGGAARRCSARRLLIAAVPCVCAFDSSLILPQCGAIGIQVTVQYRA